MRVKIRGSGFEPERSRAGCPCRLATTKNAQSLFLIVGLDAVLWICVCNINHRGRGRASGPAKACADLSNRQVCSDKLDAGDVDRGGGDHRFRAIGDAKNRSDSERHSKFLGVAG